MSAGIENLFENPLIFGLIVLAVGALIFAALKRLLKLALIFVLGLGGLAGYYAYTGRQAPPALEKVQDKVKSKVKAGAEKGAEGARRLGDKVKTTVKDAAQREAERAAKKLEDAAHKAVEEAVPQ